MTNKSLYRAFSQLDVTKKDKDYLIPAVLGFLIGGREIVDVPNRPGYVYARIRSNLNEVAQVFNDKVSPVYNLPVLLVRDPNNLSRYKIDGRDIGRYENWGTISSFLPAHGAQHSFSGLNGSGGDITWVYSQQFVPLFLYPSGTYGTDTVLIKDYPVYRNSQWLLCGNTGTASFSPYRPTGSFARMVLVSLDANGNPQLTAGSYFSAAITGTASVISQIPSPPSAVSIPLGAVRMVSGTTQISWDKIYDLRMNYGGSTPSNTVTGSSVTTFDSLTDVVVAGASSGSFVQYNGTNWINRIQPIALQGIIMGAYPTSYIETTSAGNLRLRGTSIVYDKRTYPISAGRGGASPPTWAAISGSFYGYQFAIGDDITFFLDRPGNASVSRDIIPYIGWSTSSPTAGVTGTAVKWEVTYALAEFLFDAPGQFNQFGEFDAGTISMETTIYPGTRTFSHFRTDIGSIPITDYNFGAGVAITIKRVAASGTAPASDPFGLYFGYHYVVDRMGTSTSSGSVN